MTERRRMPDLQPIQQMTKDKQSKIRLIDYNYSRFTPFEWDNPHPCNDETDEFEFDLSIHNCFWHNWGCFMEQGSDIAPRYQKYVRFWAVIDDYLFLIRLGDDYSSQLTKVFS